MDLAGVDVSRETIDRLREYESLVQKWNPSINLVSKGDLAHLWRRHFTDSIQLAGLVKEYPPNWLDIGSGGGFPGLVVAAVARELSPETKFTLVESDQRKCVFLRTVIRTLNLNCTVISSRIENCAAQSANSISARALAPLNELFGYSERHLRTGGRMYFPKGQNHADEIHLAQKNWTFDIVAHDSLTDNTAKIIEAWNLERIK